MNDETMFLLHVTSDIFLCLRIEILIFRASITQLDVRLLENLTFMKNNI